MATVRKVEVEWSGTLTEGHGGIRSSSSGALGELGLNWSARTTEETTGHTSPEELLAAAYASCFSMALAHELHAVGHVAEEVITEAAVSFQPGKGITKIELYTSAKAPGLQASALEVAARTARRGCPLSKALSGVPEITVETEILM